MQDMPSIEEMRLFVADCYDGEGWKFRVMNIMKENQIIALYAKFKDKEQKKKEDGHWEQMTIGRYLEERDNAACSIGNNCTM